MKTLIKYICIALVTAMLSGCATDPLTRTLKKFGYAPAIPAPETQHIGDVYETANLRNPYLLLREYLTKEKLNAMMESERDNVAIPNSSGGRKFNLSADVDIIGKAKVELSKYGISSFTVKFDGACQYLISKTKFYTEIYPRLEKIIQNIPGKDNKNIFNLSNKFTILALLQVKNLEYEFYNEKGGKVNVSPGSQLEQILKASIGIDWSANQNSNLSFNLPRFIGYRMGKLTERGATYVTMTKGIEAGYPAKLQIKDVPIDELRNAAR